MMMDVMLPVKFTKIYQYFSVRIGQIMFLNCLYLYENKTEIC